MLPEYHSNFGGVSPRHLKIEEEFSSKSCPFSRRFVVLASCYHLESFQFVRYSFLTHPEYVRSYFSISFHQRSSFQLSFSIYPGASFKCSLISSSYFRSLVSKSPLAYWFFKFFPVIQSLFSSIISEF